MGNARLSENVLLASPPALRARCICQHARTNVMGIMASVLVSLTTVALSSTLAPGCMLSQALAAAVTDEVSLMAVPANRPKPSLVSPSIPPSVGNTSAAITLNRKMTEIAWAISRSSASMTGAVAAMAEPPQIDEPTPTSVAILLGTFMTRQSTKAMTSEVEIVATIIGSDWAPLDRIWERFMPKPSRITAYCKTFLDV